MKLFKLLFFISILFCKTTNANFITGGSIEYQFLGSNQYLVKLYLIRDCTGNMAASSYPLLVSSASCSFTQTFVLNQVGIGIDFNPCSTITTCNGGTSLGLQLWEYQSVIVIPSLCPDWIFSVNECCRTSGITTLQNPGSENFYIEATLNNTVLDNNSVTLSNFSPIFSCIGQTNYFNLGCFDSDGDSLSFSLVNAQSGVNTDVVYNSGFSGTNPVSSTPPLVIDPATGDIISYGTIASEYGLIAVRINEFRNGSLIGSTVVNYSMHFIHCNNNPPTCSGFPFPGPVTIEATVLFCFDIFSNDPDLNDTLMMTWNGAIPTATFTITPGQYPVGQFCWTPAVSDIRPQPYTFTVTIIDNSCPGGSITCSYSLIVTPFTGINEIEKNKINIFPNPVNDFFEISNNYNLPIKKIQLSDILGNIIYNNDQNKMDISHYSDGIYFVKVELLNGSCLFGKILKE
jgi:hypothetical protein